MDTKKIQKKVYRNKGRQIDSYLDEFDKMNSVSLCCIFQIVQQFDFTQIDTLIIRWVDR